MSPLLQDVRHAARGLARSPGFTALALATLAVGIGANAAIFSVVDAVLLRPLPYASADRLVQLGDLTPDGHANNVGYETFEDLRDRNTTFESMAAVRFWQPTLVIGGSAERIPAMRVSWNYFSMLGVPPALGRDFRREDDLPDGRFVLLISDALWRRRFGADPSVIGKTVRMNDQDFRIVGVLRANYQPLVSAHFYQAAEMWAPIGYRRGLPAACRSCQHLKALGRLAPGVSFERARQDLERVRRELAAAYPRDYSQDSMAVVP